MTQAILLISVLILIELTQIAKTRKWINIKTSEQQLNMICIIYQAFLTGYMLFTHSARTEFEWTFFLIAVMIPFAEVLFLSETPKKIEQKSKV